jgi:hypothetical protein
MLATRSTGASIVLSLAIPAPIYALTRLAETMYIEKAGICNITMLQKRTFVQRNIGFQDDRVLHDICN